MVSRLSGRTSFWPCWRIRHECDSIELPGQVHQRAIELARQNSMPLDRLMVVALVEKLSELATRAKLTIEKLVARMLEEHICATEQLSYMERRALRGDLEEFARILAKVPDVPPMPGDELPEGYKPIRPNPRE